MSATENQINEAFDRIKKSNIEFYKSIGMKEDGTRFINGEKNIVLKFEKEDMQKYLNDFQANPSF